MENARGKRKEIAPIDETMKINEEIVEETIEPSNKMGIVNCFKLNLRETPSTKATILSVISHNDKVKILEDINRSWYKVYVDGIGTGFCMKDFINVIN